MTHTTDSERAEVARVLDELYAARVGGELERLGVLFAEQAHFRISGSSNGKPIAISVQQGAHIRGWLAVLLKSFVLSGYTELARLIEGRHAAVHWRVMIHSRVTGATVETELMDIIEVRGERIVSFVEFFAPV